MRSMRVQIFAFLGVLLAVMLLLVNIYPIITARDTAFHEKENAMGGQASTLAAALAKLDRPDSESVAEVLRLLDIRGFHREALVAAARLDLEGLSVPQGVLQILPGMLRDHREVLREHGAALYRAYAEYLL